MQTTCAFDASGNVSKASEIQITEQAAWHPPEESRGTFSAECRQIEAYRNFGGRRASDSTSAGLYKSRSSGRPEDNGACFMLKDRGRQAPACVYCRDEPGRRSAARLLMHNGAHPRVIEIEHDCSSGRITQAQSS
jgi:hypothetical protein